MKIEELRKKIDAVDLEILKLLNERAVLALKIGGIKKKEKIDSHDPDRESRLIREILEANRGPLGENSIKSIFREILSACLSLQRPVRAAYMGPEATFTHLAALERFGSSADYMPVKSISEVFREVEKGRCDYGVVPVENSIEGMVNYTLDMFVDSDLKICGEISMPINEHLLSREPLERIEVIYSHPQPLAQCRAWIEANLPGRRFVEAASTAEAAKLASREPSAAAIAGIAASRKYDFPVAAANIEDTPDNMTRFLVIGRKHPGRTGRDKTSAMFSVKDRIGALYDMLRPFKKHGINLTKIESRPSRKKAWDYFFFVDTAGHMEDEDVALAFGELEKECVFFKHLGSYPEAGRK